MQQITEQQILALAPNASAAANGRKISDKGGFVRLERSAGKKEKVRRVEVIDALADRAENDFYLTQLEDAEKDVKAALIYALRHVPDNIDKLLALVKSKRSNLRDTVR